MKTFLCEKPSQASDLAKVVGAHQRFDGYWASDSCVVTFAVGHLLAQSEPEAYGAQFGRPWRMDPLPVLPTQWLYDTDPKTAGQLKTIVSLLKKASEVVIATDADREGEVIARSILEHGHYTGRLSRLWVSDSTAAGIKKALVAIKPATEYAGLHASGLGRQRADWLSGMNLTRALSIAFSPGKAQGPYHFGRVQTPTLALVVRRERAIASFVATPYFSVTAKFALGTPPSAPASMRWIGAADLLDKDGRLTDKALAQRVVAEVKGQTGTIESVVKQEKRELAPLLFDLGGLQRICSERFGMSPDLTLKTVQSLYEDHKLLTYPRTDCEYIAQEMLPDAPKVLAAISAVHPELAKHITKADTTRASRAFNTAKVAASAHHAIIPTGSQSPAIGSLSEREQNVYNLVARRYLAQFLGDYVYAETRIAVDCAGHRFETIGKVPLVPGWRVLFPNEKLNTATTSAKKTRGAAAQEEDEDDTGPLPDVAQGAAAQNTDCAATEKKTQPPKRYTEATLLSAMESIDKEIDDPRLAAVMRGKEKAGIGTAATRAETFQKLYKGEYFEKKKQYLVPTEKGNALIGIMERVCPDLVDLALTAVWEAALGEVEKGAMQLQAFEAGLQRFVVKQIDLIKQSAAQSPRPARIAADPNAPTYACPTCTKPMRQLNGPNGRFWGCSGYPDCKTTLPDADGKPGEKAPPKTDRPVSPPGKVGDTCPTCKKGKLTMKSSKTSGNPYLACTNFTDRCAYFRWADQK